jgi:predicted secreted protein
MAELPARNSKLYASAAGSTYTEVTGVKDAGVDGSRDAEDVTDHDSGVFKEYIAGRASSKIAYSGNYNEADPGQAIVRTAYYTGSTCYFKFRAAVGTGIKETYCNGIVTSFKVSAGNEGVIPLTFDVQLTGTPTDSAQS